MSKLHDFFQKSKKVIIETRISNDDKKPNYFLNFLLKKGFPLIISGTLLAPSFASADVSFNKLTLENLASKYEKTGFLNVNNPSINLVSNLDKNSGSHHISGISNSCKINLSIDEKSNVESLSKDFVQNMDENLYRETAFNHEISHCVINKKFIKSGLSLSSEKWMEDWVVGDYATFNPVKNLYEENFADVMGLILTLKNHDFSDKSINFLKEWKDIRKNTRLQEEQNLPFLTDGHQTDFSLDYLINNLNKVKLMSNEDTEKFAMEAASKAVMYTLNSKRKIEGPSFVDDKGDLISGKKIYVGNKGYALINNIFNNYSETILKNAITYDYIEKNYKNENIEINSVPYLLGVQIVKETNILNKTGSKSVKKEDGTIALKIPNSEASKIINLQFSSNLVKEKFENIKKENGFNKFILDLKENISGEYKIDIPKLSKEKEKWLKLEEVLKNSPFSNDKVKLNTIKNKAP